MIATPASRSSKIQTDTTLRGWSASDSAAAALELAILRRTSLPEGQAELRIWSTIALGVPHDLLRLTRRGDKVDGMRGWYWPVDPKGTGERGEAPEVPIDAVVRYSVAGRCGTPERAGDVEACRIRFTRRPDWRAIWDNLEALGIWTLPDQDELPRDSFMVLDGWAMTVEVRDGDRYRSYAYSNPDAHQHPAQVAAAAIGLVDDHIWTLVPRSSNERLYHGWLQVGGGRSEFRVCGTSAVWGVQGSLGSRYDSLRSIAARNDSTARRSYYAELRGMLAYPGLARQWQTPYSEILEVDSVLMIRETAPGPC